MTTGFIIGAGGGIDGGSGLELCDIGMALYVDETKGLRRYLNGQIVDINTNTQAFLNRLQEITTLHPSLLCTEEEWQTAKTMSAFGQVGKFVFNYSGDEIVSVRIPAIVNVQGLFDLQNLGLTVEAGLPNINASWCYGWALNHITGAAYIGGNLGNYESYSSGGDKVSNSTIFDASRSSSIYGNSDTVQQEAIQYPYFIQIATGSETEVNIINEITNNSPYELFDFKWADHEQNNLSWLKSNGQWNSGTVYVDAYNELLTEYNNPESVEETDGEITYKRTPKGYKIALAEQETAIGSKYETHGIAWYYVLDTANKQFKLPRTKFGFEGLRTSVGNDIDAGVPNITGSAGMGESKLATGAFKFAGSSASAGNTGTGGSTDGAFTFDASRSNPIYGNSNTVQPPATQTYLYFYVGETVQNANLIDAGRIGEILPTKTDKVQAAQASMPSSKYIDLTLGASGSTYTAPANGYFTLSATTTAQNGSIYLRSSLITFVRVPYANGNSGVFLPCKKGDIVSLHYDGTLIVEQFRFVYAQGSEGEV